MSGGLYSVVWTDALQLVCIAVGLAVSAPYAALHPAVSFEKSLMSKDWLGDIKHSDLGEWLDLMLLAIFGGIPWQVWCLCHEEREHKNSFIGFFSLL